MASYVIGKGMVSRHTGLSHPKTAVAIIALVLATVMSALVPSALLTTNAAHADWLGNLLCGNDLGGWTAYQSQEDVFTSGSDSLMSEGGKYSVMDLYQNVIAWTTWNGADVTGDDSVFGGKDVTETGNSAADIQKAADNEHNAACAMRWMVAIPSNLLLFVAGLITKFMSIFVTWAVNPKIICQDPVNPQGTCVNLVGIIGGTGGSNGGIIGTLYNGMYLSLAGMVMVIVALWMLWRGIIKGEIRKSWFGLLWAVVSFFLGIIVLSNPMMVAAAPMNASVMLGSCVIETMNGRNCLSSDDSASVSKNGDTSTNTLCLIDPSKSFGMSDHLALDARMATCKMWKAFVLEPWATGQFGMNFESLQSKEADTLKQSDLITQTSNPEKLDYWSSISVSMKGASTRSLCSSNEYVYYNIALYQLDLMSDIHDCGGSSTTQYHSNAKINSNQMVYQDWKYLIDLETSAKNDTGDGATNVSHSFWEWNGDNIMTRLSLAISAVAAAIMASTIIIPSSISAIVYLFTGTLLTVFAPMFMLMGIHPTTGKKMFLGWLELELGAVLKYLFMILWVSVVVEIYGAILGATTNLAMSLIFIVAMTVTLKTYQKELLNIFGNVDLGGKKLSNALGDKFSGAMHKVDNLAKATAGGAAAGFINGEGGFGSRLRSARDMAGYQTMQQGKYMGGFVGNAFQSADRIQDKRRQALIKDKKEENKKVMAAADAADDRSVTSTAGYENLATNGLTGLTDEDYASEDARMRVEKARLDALQDNDRNHALDKKVSESYDRAGYDADVEAAGQDEKRVAADKNGVFRTSNPDDEIANEFAYRRNQAALADLSQNGKLTSDGYKFEDAHQQEQYDNLQATLDAGRAGHDDYVDINTGIQQAAAQAQFDEMVAANPSAMEGKTVGGMLAGADEYERNRENIESQYAASKDAIEARKVMVRNSEEATAARSVAEKVVDYNDKDVMSRSAGRWTSGRQVRAAEERSKALDAAIATNSLGSAGGAVTRMDAGAFVADADVHSAAAQGAVAGVKKGIESIPEPIKRAGHDARMVAAAPKALVGNVLHPFKATRSSMESGNKNIFVSRQYKDKHGKN